MLAEDQPLERAGAARSRRARRSWSRHRRRRPSRGALGKAARSRSSLVTPFWNESSVVCGPDHRADLLERGGRVPQLDADHDEIGDADLGRDRRSPAPWPAPAACRRPRCARPRSRIACKMRAARDEVHVSAAAREARAEIAADAAGAHHRDFHGSRPATAATRHHISMLSLSANVFSSARMSVLAARDQLLQPRRDARGVERADHRLGRADRGRRDRQRADSRARSAPCIRAAGRPSRRTA